MSNVAVVILNWNKAEQTRHCLHVARLTTAASVHWVVVDNGSSEQLDGMDGDVTLLRNAENLGFAGGVNLGLRYAFQAKADYVWLLNNDAEPLPGALDALVAAASGDPAIGLASSVILNSDDNDAVEFHGGLWSDFSYHKTADAAQYETWFSTMPDRIWVVGTALLVTRRLVEQIGYFDERLFAYWEDNDISRRSSAAGFRNVVVTNSRVRHESGHPEKHPEERPPYFYYYMTRNELLLLRKMGELTRFRPVYWMLRRTIRLYRRLRRLPAQQQAVRRGVVDGLAGRGGVFRSRM